MTCGNAGQGPFILESFKRSVVPCLTNCVTGDRFLNFPNMEGVTCTMLPVRDR
jgi:hypothetical protein